MLGTAFNINESETRGFTHLTPNPIPFPRHVMLPHREKFFFSFGAERPFGCIKMIKKQFSFTCRS